MILYVDDTRKGELMAPPLDDGTQTAIPPDPFLTLLQSIVQNTERLVYGDPGR